MEFFNSKKRKTETKLVSKGSPKKKPIKTAEAEAVKRRARRRGKGTKNYNPVGGL